MSVYDELVGQASAIAQIQRAAAAARAAHEVASPELAAHEPASGGAASSAMTHAWLFTGPPGSGRSLAAQVLAAALECTGDIPGCGECAQCKAVMGKNHPDVMWVSTEAVTITAEEVRAYVARSYVAPEAGKYRIFIVEDADRMLARTANVLLKAIEEPAEHTVWMLCTAAVADVLPTIRSRMRNINLVAPSAQDVAQLLTARDGVSPEAALVAARAAQSHIGVAKALATDPDAAALRHSTLSALVSIETVCDAAFAARMFLDADAMYIDTSSSKGKASRRAQKDSGAASKNSDEEKAMKKRMEALGLDPEAKIPAAVRSQVKSETDQAQRRKTRLLRDMLDRELVYVESYYRDVLVMQLGAHVELINSDYSQAIERTAAQTELEQTIHTLDAMVQARRRIHANVAPLLAMEAALMSVVPSQ